MPIQLTITDQGNTIDSCLRQKGYNISPPYPKAGKSTAAASPLGAAFLTGSPDQVK